jgi:ABC-2 type transport system ATP-binding protein
MAGDSLVRAKGMHRYYGTYCAIKAVNIHLKKGEVLGLLGPNGAGKSTMMQMLTGNLAPSQGEIQINGIDLLEQPRLAKRHIGYLPERPPVYSDMTVDEYLHYCAKLHDIAVIKQDDALQQAKHRCGLDDVGHRLIANLSKGFQQRVGIAQAIIHTPDVVILDEPTVGLDPIQIQAIRTLIRELGKDHSVILSTHILPEVQAVCDRVQIIHQGETVFDDSLKNLEQRHSQPILICQFSQSIDINKLMSLAHIETVVAKEHHCYHVKHIIGKNIVSDIFQIAQQNDWEIQALTPLSTTLENIFMNLIHGEEATA